MKTVMTGRRVHAWSAIGASVAMILAAASVRADETQQTSAERATAITIPAGSLDRSLQAYAEAMNIQLVYAPELVAGLRSRGLSGSYGRREALELLLNESGLRFRFVNERTVTLERTPKADVRTLGPVRVEGAQSQEGPPRIGEGVATMGGVRGQQEAETKGYRPVVSTVGSGRPIPIEDNPRAVSVLTREQMEDQNINDLGEALNRLPGVSVSSTIYSRGQSIQRFQVDGGSAYDFRQFLRDENTKSAGPEFAESLNLAGYERVELVRGPNSAFVGHGSLGGTLNLVRKRPGAEPAESLSLTAGSWNRWEGTYDVTVPNIASSNIAFRGVVDLQTTDAFYDKFSRENGTAYGILDIPLSETSRGELGLSYTKSDTDAPYIGVLRYADGPLMDFSRETNFGPKWNFTDFEEREAFTRLKTDFSDRWTMNVGLTWKQLDHGTTLVEPLNNTFLSNGGITPFNSTRSGEFIMYTSTAQILTGDVRVAGSFETWGLTHNVMALASYYDLAETRRSAGWLNTAEPVQNIDEFFVDDTDLDPMPRLRSVSSNRRLQASVEDVLAWRDKIDLRLALGYTAANNYSYAAPFVWQDYFDDGRDLLFGTTASSVKLKPDVTPSYAVVFKPWRGWSFAPSYAEGTMSQGGYYTPAGEELPAINYKNQELMMRYAANDWVASASYYTADNDNVRIAIPGQRTCGPTRTAACYYAGGASMESDGYDLELAGELFHQLNVSASYSFNETTVIATQAPQNTESPSRIAKLFLGWAPPLLPKLRFSLGYSYRSDIYVAGTRRLFDDAGAFLGSLPYRYMNKGFNLFDVGVRYMHSPSLQFALLAENVTDETYLLTTNATLGMYGRPRNVSLTFKWQGPSIRQWGGGTGSTGEHYPLGDPSRWYTALDVGMHSLSDITAKGIDGSNVKWNWQLDSNLATFWRLGRHINDRWRVEFEGGYRPVDIDATYSATAEPGGFCSTATGAPAFPECNRATGKFDTFSVMANGLYHPWGEQRRVSPFVGLGLGAARSQIQIGGRLPNRVVSGVNISAGTDDTFIKPAVQAIAGLSLQLADRLTADLTYRHFYVPDAEWDFTADYRATSLSDATDYGPSGFSSDLEDRSLTLAFRWNFDAGTRASR